jgi:hypothetical protein
LARAVFLAATSLLCGCKLIDQRTFESTGRRPSSADVAHAQLPQVPLVTLDFAQVDQDWRTPLAQAAAAAILRKPDVEFDVVTPIPTSGNRALQDGFARLGQADAQAVATALLADQVSPDRIHLRFHGDPGVPKPRVVYVYVR